MRIFLILVIFFIFQHCSFDYKSGIWKNETEVDKETNDDFSQFEDLITANILSKRDKYRRRLQV